MVKVCVVTLYKHNYGAFLQAYALQQFLKDKGYEPCILDYDYFKDNAILGISTNRIRNPVSFLKSIAYRISRYRVFRQRDVLLDQCAKKMMNQTKYYKHYLDVKKDPPMADIYITGSDQVWNPTISGQGFASRLLDFAPENGSVLCSYAASVGVKEFSRKVQYEIRNHLKRFDRISVRELASAEMIRDLTDKVIVLHKDPALLLTKEQWDRFQVKVESQKPYIFIYLAQNDPKLVAYASHLSEQQGWDVVDCHGSINYHINHCVNGNRILSPMEFVGGIRNAAYVVTNSFHCLAFTIHYKKKAFVKMPPNGAGRLSELIHAMSLERITVPELISDSELVGIYNKTEACLASERKKAEEYFSDLNEVLKKKRAHDDSSKIV